MKMKTINQKKAISFALMFALLSGIFFSLTSFNAACDDLRANVLRLHIIANSDTEEDQNLKLKVRDAILAESEDLFLPSDNIEEATALAKGNLAEFQKTAQRVIESSGYNYPVNVSISNTYFETRVYDNFTLPAGEYPSLIVTIGEGSGKNWWCVIFPEVCIPTATADLSDSVEKKNADVAKNSDRYIVRFKIVEIYEQIKKFINK